jgi:ribonuclease VapC
MFVDASAIVAILTREKEADVLLDKIETAPEPITSAIALFEATAGLCRKRQSSVEQAHDDVMEFLTEAGIKMVSIAAPESRNAIAAFAKYGKGRGHPAQLNLGDCFAYAVAKTNNVPLLFKGGDFSLTDIRSA